MPSPTYIALATTTLSSSASSITFGSIPNTYRDLILVVFGRTDAARRYEFTAIHLNGDTSTSYDSVNIYWEAGGRGSYTGTNVGALGTLGLMGAQASSNHFNTCRYEIMDYSANDKHKTVLYRADDPGRQTYIYTGRYPSTNVITSVTFKTIQGASMIAGTTLTLYGVGA